MAVPTITATTTYVSATSDATSWTPFSGITVVVDELLVLIVSADGNAYLTTASAGWNKLGQDGSTTVVQGAVFWKIATSTSESFTLDSTTSEQFSAVLHRVSGADTITGFPANGSSTNSNPPSHSADVAVDALWFATRSGDSTVVASAAPTNYSALDTATAGGTGGASTQSCSRGLSATQTEDPGTFTSATEQWVSWTLAVWALVPQSGPFVGKSITTKPGTTSGNTTIALNVGLYGGSRTHVETDDLVIAIFASASTVDRTLAITDGTDPYTLLGSELYADGSTRDANLRVAYKFMGATPDTTVTFGPTGATDDAGTMAVYVYSDIDLTTPLDVAVTTATGTGTARANPPSITPTTTGATVLAIGAGGATTGAVFTSSDLTDFLSVFSVDNNDSILGVGYIGPWTSGAVDPAVFGGGSAVSDESWAAMSIALRPAAGGPAIAGTTTLTFTTDGILKGAGALEGSLLLASPCAGILTGAGALSGTTSLTFTTAGILTGAGALVGASSLTFTPTATLGLSGTSTLTFTPAGTLQASGRLHGALLWVSPCDGILTGAGALSGATSLTFTSSAALEVLIAGATSLTFSPTATLQATGSLSGTTSVTFTATGDMPTADAIQGTSSLTFTTAGVLTGAGALEGALLWGSPCAGILRGSGALAGASSLSFTTTGAILAQGSLYGATTITFSPSGALVQPATPIQGSAAFAFTASGVLINYGWIFTRDTAPAALSTTLHPAISGWTFTRDTAPSEWA